MGAVVVAFAVLPLIQGCCNLSIPTLNPLHTPGASGLTVDWKPYTPSGSETLRLGPGNLDLLPNREVFWQALYSEAQTSSPVGYLYRWPIGGSVVRAIVPYGLGLQRAGGSDTIALPSLWTYSSGTELNVLQAPSPGAGGFNVWATATRNGATLLSLWGVGNPPSPPRVILSNDGGVTWSTVLVGADGPGTPNTRLLSLESNGTSIVAFRSTYGGNGRPPLTELYGSQDGGATWSPRRRIPVVHELNFLSVSMTAQGDYLAGCDYWTTLPPSVVTFDVAGNLYHSYPNPCMLTSFWTRDQGVVTTDSVVSWSADAGRTLQPIYTVPAGLRVTKARMVSDHEVVVLLAGATPARGRLVYLVNNAGTWTPQTVADL